MSEAVDSEAAEGEGPGGDSGLEESGGVQGLRAWAADAAGRVRELVPAVRAGALPPRSYDAAVAELDQLVWLLDHEPELRGAVSVWLGGALAMRYSAGGGEPSDRERAERLLREARDPGTALGAAVGAEERRWAALFLVTAITPIHAQQGGYGDVPDLSALVDWVGRAGPSGMVTFAAELRELTEEVRELPLPPQFLAELDRMRGLFSTPPGPEFTELLMSVMPEGDDGDPYGELLREMLDRLFGSAGAAGSEGAAGPAGAPGDGAAGAAGAGPAADADSAPRTSPSPENPASPSPENPSSLSPEDAAVLTPDNIRRWAAGLDAVNGATHGLDDVLKSGDAEALNGLLRKLRSVQDDPPLGPDPTGGLEAIRAMLLDISAVAGGTLQDRSAGRAHREQIVRHLEGLGGSVPGIEDPAAVARAFTLYGRLMDEDVAEDAEALRGLLAEAEELAAGVPEDHRFRFAADLALAAARLRLGIAVGDRELQLLGVQGMEQGAAAVHAGDLPFADELPRPAMPDFDLLRAGLTGAEIPAFDHVSPPADASTDEVHSSSLTVALHYSLTRDPAVLDVLIGELERVRDGVREGRAPRIAADALWSLAEAYRERGVLGEDVKDLRAIEAAREALSALAADVLLQAGAEHGLIAARSGANRGVQAALWAASQGRLHEAVASLELGRALVLHAASTSSAVPELLDERGRHDLAEAWRAADPSPTDGAPGAPGVRGAGVPGAPGVRGAGVPGELPSTLRRRALEALGYRKEGGLLGTPTPADLSDGLAECGADALVHLVPGQGGPGVAIVIAPDLGIGMKVLPLLSDDSSAPLERYLDATELRDTAAREGRPQDPAAARSWEEALGELCDWAHEVLDPVVTDLEAALREAVPNREPGAPPRLVLVPCGRLGLVPWHAARAPGEAPRDFLCRRAVISYAASGGQLLRTVRRAPRAPAAAPVLLADPTLDLTHAEVEVMALRDAYYRRARVCGALFGLPEEELAAAGTPEDVLAFLADGTSLLHVASHGSAGTRPTVSALHLAAPRSAEGAGEQGGADPGLLTVTRLLDRTGPSGAQLPDSDGPLVVLSACQTDLSTRDHDEALTLTTAFLSAGARDVVGSRWTVDDGASALLMAVFHHHLTVDGLAPADALRAAQLWMLDPDRENPPSLDGPLLRQAERPDLDRIALWAAFTHQGHPGRAAHPTEDPSTDEDRSTSASQEGGPDGRTQ